MLQLRPLIRKYFWFQVGNGSKTLAWYDNWCNNSPLQDRFTTREITSAGFSIDAKVADLVIDNVWQWPNDWAVRCPALRDLPNLSSAEDKILWKDRNNTLQDFSIGIVWEDLRPRLERVEWTNLVWFSFCIPKHAFILWLVFRRRLKTQDMLMQWDMQHSIHMLCPFCDLQPDSHEHLFFECQFCLQVWSRVFTKAGLAIRPANWSLLVAQLQPSAGKKSMKSVIEKLILAASVYFLWQERNSRLFMQKSRSAEAVAELILSTVRLKMLTFRYKRSPNVERLLAAWDLPVLLIND